MDFSANPPKHDHFGKFFEEVLSLTPKNFRMELLEMGIENRKDTYHLGGLTQNYYSFKHNDPLYKPKEFLAYNF